MTDQTKVKGVDCQGKPYASIEAMWKEHLGDGHQEKEDKWYGHSGKYWSAVEPTDDGMLGGFEELTKPDSEFSNEFIRQVLIKKHHIPTLKALDCGAGIGRVTKHVLSKHFEHVDLLEQEYTFLEKAKETMGTDYFGYICKGLQDFKAEGPTYSVIWIQWVIIYLTDDDFISFLVQCRKAVEKGGVICIKDNICKSGFIVDREDASITRSDALLRNLFTKAGLKVLEQTTQKNFPPKLFQVNLYALVPSEL